MVGKYYVIFALALFATSCAQVGFITGGEEDTTAPKPITEKVNPPNESTNFTGNSVEIPFDEFFKLKSPSQNIRMVPPHSKVDATVKGKTLTLSWDKTLQPNTTYAIYLNNAIEDLTENNDTIIQYVFSTGAVLDTLSYGLAVMDAFTGDPIEECVVGLFQPMSNRLISLAEVSNGVATLKYLRPGEYRAVAFVDENNDLELQDYEKVAFPEGGKIIVDSSYMDSIPWRMYEPAAYPKTKSVSFIAPGSFVLTSAHRHCRTGVRAVYVNGESVEWNTMLEPNEYDRHVFVSHKLEGPSAEIVVDYGEVYIDAERNFKKIKDTVTYRFKNDEQNSIVNIEYENIGLIPSEHLALFNLNAMITDVDSSKIHLINNVDSSIIEDVYYSFVRGDKSFDFGVSPLDTIIPDVSVKFDEGAITTVCGPAGAFEKSVLFGEEKDFGEIVVDISGYEGRINLQLLHKNKVKSDQVLFLAKDKVIEPIVFNNLLPGEYSFRVIRSPSCHNSWGAGQYKNLRQPDVVDNYSKTTKVRANWSIEVTLAPKTE